MMVNDEVLRAQIEGILYVAPEPVTLDTIVKSLPDEDRERIKAKLQELTEEYEKPEHGIHIRQVAGGYKFATKPEHQGQLSAAAETLAALGVTDLPLVAIAKGPDRDAGRETFFMPGRAPFKLPPRDPLLYFIERLRDEAHRFAIGSHRARRKKDIREAGLQEIPGIGPTRKRALLRHFGTLKAIERASLPDLAQVPGINAETARKIYEFFHEQAAQ